MCCCCPPAINALFCLWVQSGCSKGTVAGALTFFPPEPALYSFERVDSNGRPVSDGAGDDGATGGGGGGDLELKTEKMDRGSTKDASDTSSSNASSGNNNNKKKSAKNKKKKSSKNTVSIDENEEAGNGTNGGGDSSQHQQQVEVTHVEGEVDSEGNYHAREGQSREKVRSPAQQVTDRAKELRSRAKQRNAQDQQDAKNGVQYKLHLDPRLQPPRFGGGGRRSGSGGSDVNDDECIQAVKIPCGRKQNGSSYCAAIVYKVPAELKTDKTFTIIYSHGNATDIGAMFPLQSILAHSLQCNVVSYDYSGYGESGGVAMESNTYTDIEGVYKWTLENVCNGDGSRIILYGQSVGSGPCCYLAGRVKRSNELGGMILHSPFMSGMRVLTPSRLLSCLDIYPNIDRIRKTKCPVMVIHGRLDEEVSIEHGVELHQAVPTDQKREPWWVPDRGHNDITEGPGKLAEYVRRLRNFLATLD